MLRLIVLHLEICNEYHYYQQVLNTEVLDCFQNHVHIEAKFIMQFLLR